MCVREIVISMARTAAPSRLHAFATCIWRGYNSRASSSKKSAGRMNELRNNIPSNYMHKIIISLYVITVFRCNSELARPVTSTEKEQEEQEFICTLFNYLY